jgi:hypothetical protein
MIEATFSKRLRFGKTYVNNFINNKIPKNFNNMNVKDMNFNNLLEEIVDIQEAFLDGFYLYSLFSFSFYFYVIFKYLFTIIDPLLIKSVDLENRLILFLNFAIGKSEDINPVSLRVYFN